MKLVLLYKLGGLTMYANTGLLICKRDEMPLLLGLNRNF